MTFFLQEFYRTVTILLLIFVLFVDNSRESVIMIN